MTVSKLKLQTELHSQRGRDGVDGSAETRRFQQPHGDSVIRAIEQIEKVRAKNKPTAAGKSNRLADSQVEVQQPARSKCVSSDLAVPAGRRQQSREVRRLNRDRLSSVF